LQQAANITYWIAFTAGILSFASPCVLPLIPSYLTYITGLSFSQLEDAHPNAKMRMTVLLHSLCFILGFTVVFVLLGAIAGAASSKFQLYLREGLEWVEKIGGLFIFLFGVHMTGLFHFGVLLGEKRVHLHFILWVSEFPSCSQAFCFTSFWLPSRGSGNISVSLKFSPEPC
jgi:cytochrome c-type biogenesis protein